MYHERSKEVNLFQIYNMDSGNVVGLSCRSERIILSTEVNLCLLGKRIASSKFCLGRTCISITMKFINEVVNGRVTIILFVVTNLVCYISRKGKNNIYKNIISHHFPLFLEEKSFIDKVFRGQLKKLNKYKKLFKIMLFTAIAEFAALIAVLFLLIWT